MPHRQVSDKSELGDSWVVNDSDADSSGDDPEDPAFEPSIRLPSNGRKESQRRSIDVQSIDGNLPKRGQQSIHVPQRRSSRNSPKPTTGPDLIMPAICEDGAGRSWVVTKNVDKAKPYQSPKKRHARNDTPGTAPSKAQTTSIKDSRSRSTTYDQIDQSAQNLIHLLAPIFSWVYDVLLNSLHFLKTPISLFLAFYLFLVLGQITQNFLTSSLSNALSPLCRFPGATVLVPSCKTRISPPDTPVEFEELMSVQSQFEDVLSASANSVSLPLDMKRSETSIRDLRAIVRFSTLQAKNELSLEFDGFIETARIASYDLQRFNGHVGRAVDSVLSTARWTARILDDIALAKNNYGLLPTFIKNRILAPFKPLRQTPEARLLDQYIVHTQAISSEITRLITEAQALLYVLQNLEDRLETIHEIALRENVAAQGNKDDLLAHLWTMLGGNRAKLHKYNDQLRLLRQVGEYRKNAYTHVSNMIVKLQAMGSELESLRERVGSAEVERDAGAEVPLRAHIESIEMGVDRLEKARDAARGLEGGTIRRALDANEAMGRSLDGSAVGRIGDR